MAVTFTSYVETAASRIPQGTDLMTLSAGTTTYSATVAGVSAYMLGMPNTWTANQTYTAEIIIPTANLLVGGSTLGTAAFANTGTSGANVPLLNGTNTWSAAQTATEWLVGSPGYSTTGVTAGFFTTTAAGNFFQVSLQNLSAASGASADYIATANDGSDTTHYVDVGINNSGGGAAPFTNAHAGYLYNTDAELDIGALGTGGVVNVYTGGGTSTPTLNSTYSASSHSVAGQVVATAVGPASDATDGMKMLYTSGTGWLAVGPSDGISFGAGNLSGGGLPPTTLATLSSTGVFVPSGGGVTQANPNDATTSLATDQFTQNAIQWSMATAAIGNVTGGTFSFDGSGTGANVTITAPSGIITSVVVGSSGGSGWAVGDIFTVVAANYDSYCRVTGIAGGAITTATILYGGTGYVGASNVPITVSKTTPFTFVLTGTLTSNATFLLPTGSRFFNSEQYIICNNTTGGYTVTFKLATNNSPIGTGVVIPQGASNSISCLVQTDGVSDIWFATPYVGTSGYAGQMLIGSATGGLQGAGTLNATGLYINGVAVSAGGGITALTGDVTASGSGSVAASLAFTPQVELSSRWLS